ncbi:MAG: phosphoribosylamine--glycine ligase [Rhodospirillales bacterium]|jgi:phosphoribosylamine--glycine ligase|nr:phosphoribosylamine--glycine ligase [Rhodospirillales bacterium]MBT4006692.1 phosphoribosylamine--glycine ligase [Rhodospirillales bacterium]MBT5075241.1 phosphoribosylamine--glycine ligase [Rhodospirillales bacterium]MBT5113970.1 phosphoribosylamine--glycine ligase [Rhodospirillales bacterium]MBT5672498.1 phosphoribosylamine--glycine ligase [Rhodospirillales bacterium]
MKVLVIGSGGREHALCWALAASPLTDTLYGAPGNPGIANHATCVDIAVDDIPAIRAFVKSEGIDFVVVGPEVPLVAGLVDELTLDGVKAFGPTALAARLEGSKGFTKDICTKYNIPTAAYGRFSDVEKAHAYLKQVGAPIVVKADGLAAGKGVIMAETMDQAEAAVSDILEGNRFGDAGAEVVIEEWMDGEEASFFALVDGETALPLASAQDHKRVGDGDTGPNTGGMGAYSPAPVVTDAMATRIMDEIIMPTVRAMKEEGCPYKGVLYAGLMIDDQGPKLIEYNARFGDPECQALMVRLRSDILPALIASSDGQLKNVDLRWVDDAAMTVVMAAKGYPGDYDKGTEIKGIEDAEAIDGVTVFHAGTKADDGRILATGGRVLNITATAPTIGEAQTKAYQAVDKINWPEGFCRRDIGFRAVNR